MIVITQVILFSHLTKCAGCQESNLIMQRVLGSYRSWSHFGGGGLNCNHGHNYIVMLVENITMISRISCNILHLKFVLDFFQV